MNPSAKLFTSNQLAAIDIWPKQLHVTASEPREREGLAKDSARTCHMLEMTRMKDIQLTGCEDQLSAPEPMPTRSGSICIDGLSSRPFMPFTPFMPPFCAFIGLLLGTENWIQVT